MPSQVCHCRCVIPGASSTLLFPVKEYSRWPAKCAGRLHWNLSAEALPPTVICEVLKALACLLISGIPLLWAWHPLPTCCGVLVPSADSDLASPIPRGEKRGSEEDNHFAQAPRVRPVPECDTEGLHPLFCKQLWLLDALAAEEIRAGGGDRSTAHLPTVQPGGSWSGCRLLQGVIACTVLCPTGTCQGGSRLHMGTR